MAVIDQRSPLRLLPVNLDRQQALYLDGIRHAVEIADLAFRRLCGTLALIAQEEKPDGVTTAAFADAWTFVDAVDRFRALDRLFPGGREMCGPPTEIQHALPSQLRAIRKLRNVADHVLVVVPQALSKRRPVLGMLTWFVLNDDRRSGTICQLMPGSIVGETSGRLVNPAGRTMNLLHGVGLITLSAGAHEACLSETYDSVASRVKSIEAALEGQTAGMEHAASDVLTLAIIEFPKPDV